MGGGIEALVGGAAPAAAAGGEVSPLTAGLMGAGPKSMFPVPPSRNAGTPPVPGRNQLFYDPAGDAHGARLIKESPGMASAFGSMMSKPSGPTPGGDSGGSFESKAWSPPETVQGKDVTGQNWQPTRSKVMPEATQNAAPASPTSTPSVPSMFGRPPAPERNPAMQPTPGGLGFDTSAPRAPASAQAQGAAKPPTLFGVELPGIQRGQDFLKAAPTNPMLQTSLGLLASGYDGSNPYANIAANLRGIQPHELALRSAAIADSAEGRKQKEAADETKDAEIRALMAQMMMGNLRASGAVGGGGVASSQGQARVR